MSLQDWAELEQLFDDLLAYGYAENEYPSPEVDQGLRDTKQAIYSLISRREMRYKRIVDEAIEMAKNFKWVSSMQKHLLGTGFENACGNWDFATDEGVIDFKPLLNAVKLFKSGE